MKDYSVKEIVLILPRENIIAEEDVFREKHKVNLNSMKILRNKNFEVFREPLGLESIAANFRKKGYHVKLFFCDMEDTQDEDIIEYVVMFQVRFIGLSVLFDRHLEHALVLGKKLKRNNNYIFLGGPFASFAARNILDYSSGWLDGICIGEGEIVDVNIADAIYGGRSFKNIKGLFFIDKNGNFVCNQREKKCDLNQIERPDRDFIERAFELGYPLRVASIYTSRGCAQQCTFCTGSSFQRFSEGKLWSCRRAKQVVDEVEILIRKYGIKYFYICDDNFYGYGYEAQKRVLDILSLIEERGIKAKFHFEMRVDCVTEDIMLKLKQAGFTDVLLGIEAGVQSMLDRWKKGITVQHNIDAINTVRRCGLDLKPGFILFDGETSFEELCENIDFIKTMKLYEGNHILDLINPLQIFNGSPIYKSIYPAGYMIDKKKDLSEKEFVRSISHFPYKINDYRVQLFWKVIKREIDEISEFISGDIIAQIYSDWNYYDKGVISSFLKKYSRLQNDAALIILDLCDYIIDRIINDDTENLENVTYQRYDFWIRQYYSEGLANAVIDLEKKRKK